MDLHVRFAPCAFRNSERFLMPVPEGAATTAPPYKVVLNWTSTLK
jgi:hypothetical protein